MRAPLAVRCEPDLGGGGGGGGVGGGGGGGGGMQKRRTNGLYVFEHKTQYILKHAPHTRTVAFWHISNIPPRIS